MPNKPETCLAFYRKRSKILILVLLRWVDTAEVAVGAAEATAEVVIVAVVEAAASILVATTLL